MKKKQKAWIIAPPRNNAKVSEADKETITSAFAPIIDDFKIKCISKAPDKSSNYLADIYSKWNRNYFYVCQKFKAEFPERIVDEYENGLIRLEYTDKDCFNFSYFRHIGTWHLVSKSRTLLECIELFLSNPNFQPMAVTK